MAKKQQDEQMLDAEAVAEDPTPVEKFKSPQIEVKEFTASDGQKVQVVMAVFIGRGVSRGATGFMAAVHPGLTKDGGIYDMTSGKIVPIDVRRYHLAVGSRQFVDVSHASAIQKKHEEGLDGSEIGRWIDAEKPDWLIKPLNEDNSPVGEEVVFKPEG